MQLPPQPASLTQVFPADAQTALHVLGHVPVSVCTHATVTVRGVIGVRVDVAVAQVHPMTAVLSGQKLLHAVSGEDMGWHTPPQLDSSTHVFPADAQMALQALGHTPASVSPHAGAGAGGVAYGLSTASQCAASTPPSTASMVMRSVGPVFLKATTYFLPDGTCFEPGVKSKKGR